MFQIVPLVGNMELKDLVFTLLIVTTVAVYQIRAHSCGDDGWCCGYGKCYKGYCGEKDWTEALQHCRGLGYDLASIHSLDQQILAVQTMVSVPTGLCPEDDDEQEDDFWIGLHTDDGSDSSDPDDSEWVWSDGSDYDFQFWGTGEPDGANAARIDGNHRGRWNAVDRHDEQYRAWLCEKSADGGGILDSIHFY